MVEIYPKNYKQNSNEGNNFFSLLEKKYTINILPIACGRSAILNGIRELGFIRPDEIFVPQFLGQCILSTLTYYSFPVLRNSRDTKAVFVFHQFGFPQKIEEIEHAAKTNNWIIVNDCAHSIFTKVNNEYVYNWGDFSIFSFSKLYPCCLGGGFYSNNIALCKTIKRIIDNPSSEDKNWVKKAFEVLSKANNIDYNEKSFYEIHSIFGCLPHLLNISENSCSALPGGLNDIENDINNRKNILSRLKSTFPDRIPQYASTDAIPFAVPIRGDINKLKRIAEIIKEKLNFETPIMHFDFAQNMLEPQYSKALVIGCHLEWTESILIKIIKIMKSVF